MSDERISDDGWETIVSNVPIVSIDLVVLVDGGVLLGRRTNEPAKGEWFVPGGRVQKHERLREAVHRVARDELGVDVDVVERLGAYEHLYDASDVDGSGGKHYLANGFVVCVVDDDFVIDDQHEEVRVFDPDDLPDLHPYVRAYLEDADVVSTD